MAQKTVESSGRTLLEMCGVLALMGLLTVGSMTLFGQAITKVRLNDLLNEARKRALVTEKNSSRLTYGMFDKQSGGASPVSAYGYGLGDNNTGVVRTDKGYTLVPVGRINGGKEIDKRLCKGLLSIVQAGSNKKGDVVGIYQYTSRCSYSEVSDCGEEDEDAPQVLCIGIKY